MSCNRHDNDAIDLSAVFVQAAPATTASALPPGEAAGQIISMGEECIMFCSADQPLPMGVTVGANTFRAVAAVPLLDLAKIDAQIEHWRKKSAAAPDKICRAMAEGHVSGLQLVRAIHGLPMLPESGEGRG
ncbi:hypothetical protein [Desulfuromonas sp. TF]|uniref:hypothetical protein n=1 Tax=Desulfuromonas sp. TF TaxID=1232410 RepID=UPI000400C3A5|nr:hypothetical protein [Desulfuromonas sp. TF]